VLRACEFRDIVSGQRGGLPAHLWRGAFQILELPYGLAVCARNRYYDCRKAAVQRVGVPVVSVGNLTVGGTGKTPLVAWLVRWYQHRGTTAAIVSRGYGGKSGGRNDEALELEQKLPGVRHVQRADRIAAARSAVKEFGCRLVVLDDGFQHRRIHRDLDIVLIDAIEPFGYQHLLPRGLLREPLSSLRRAHVIALSRADLVSAEERSCIQREVGRHAPRSTWVEIAHCPRSLLSWPDRTQSLDFLDGQRVAAFCGIGNPEGFRRTLAGCGLKVVAFREFPDHHPYDQEDIEELASWLQRCEASAGICTHKDLVKILAERLGSCPLSALFVHIEVLTGLAELEAHLQRIFRSG
jgi:tetraacyldisaccharide 4'-kinase